MKIKGGEFINLIILDIHAKLKPRFLIVQLNPGNQISYT